MARRNIIEYSDDEELHEQAYIPSFTPCSFVTRSYRTSPPPSPVKRKGDEVDFDHSDVGEGSDDNGDDDDDGGSIADFIDDRALDELSEHSDSAEEGFSESEVVDRCVNMLPVITLQLTGVHLS